MQVLKRAKEYSSIIILVIGHQTHVGNTYMHVPEMFCALVETNKIVVESHPRVNSIRSSSDLRVLLNNVNS